MGIPFVGYQKVLTQSRWTGINAVLYYAPVIFGKLGLSSNSVSLLATGVVGIVMFIATIPAVMYVDRWGRKPTLVIGAIGMAICHFIIVSASLTVSLKHVLIHLRPP